MLIDLPSCHEHIWFSTFDWNSNGENSKCHKMTKFGHHSWVPLSNLNDSAPRPMVHIDRQARRVCNVTVSDPHEQMVTSRVLPLDSFSALCSRITVQRFWFTPDYMVPFNTGPLYKHIWFSTFSSNSNGENSKCQLVTKFEHHFWAPLNNLNDSPPKPPVHIDH